MVWKITDWTIFETTFGRNNCETDSVGFVVVRNMSVNMEKISIIYLYYYITQKLLHDVVFIILNKIMSHKRFCLV